MGPEEFDYQLPEELIAQYPLPRRDASRLLVLSRSTGAVEHKRFSDLSGQLLPGDVLVLNDTRVIPARLLGRRSTGGRVELFLLRNVEGCVWECLVKSSKGPRPGEELFFTGDGEELRARLVERRDKGLWTAELNTVGAVMVMDAVNAIGHVPLPPYIRRDDEGVDKERYQTVFAASPGAVAAPTAGLHFTDALIGAIKEKGVEVHYVTLHTGAATFMPVRVEDIRDHSVPEEFFEVDRGVYEAIKMARGEGRRVIAVGSTVTRALETVFKAEPAGPVLKGGTDLFIYPPFEFRAAKGLLTNFHLPASSLLMLVCAFAGTDKVLAAYREAVKEGYRFYSYGDAMLVI